MKDYKTIYEQRYQTFRHFDKLRWFILQITISVIAGSIILGDSELKPNVFAMGLLIFLTGMVMAKINEGVDENNIILSMVGNKIGDTSIPVPPKFKYFSMSWIIACGLIFMGSVMFFIEILQLAQILFKN